MADAEANRLSKTLHNESTATKPKTEEPKGVEVLPKLTASQFRAYNRMAENMDYYHNRFRYTWNAMYAACVNNKLPENQPVQEFIFMGREFCNHIGLHHSIEERHIFPMLATKMPSFQSGGPLISQHREIHEGMDRLENYLDNCLCGRAKFSLKEMKKLMDSFGAVLWAHLDEEVRTLGAENVRKYWTLEELDRLPL